MPLSDLAILELYRNQLENFRQFAGMHHAQYDWGGVNDSLIELFRQYNGELDTFDIVLLLAVSENCQHEQYEYHIQVFIEWHQSRFREPTIWVFSRALRSKKELRGLLEQHRNAHLSR